MYSEQRAMHMCRTRKFDKVIEYEYDYCACLTNVIEYKYDSSKNGYDHMRVRFLSAITPSLFESKLSSK